MLVIIIVGGGVDTPARAMCALARLLVDDRDGVLFAAEQLHHHRPNQHIVVDEHAQQQDHKATQLHPAELALQARDQDRGDPDDERSHRVEHCSGGGRQLLGHRHAGKVEEGNTQYRAWADESGSKHKCFKMFHMEQ